MVVLLVAAEHGPSLVGPERGGVAAESLVPEAGTEQSAAAPVAAYPCRAGDNEVEHCTRHG